MRSGYLQLHGFLSDDIKEPIYVAIPMHFAGHSPKEMIQAFFPPSHLSSCSYPSEKPGNSLDRYDVCVVFLRQ